MSSDNIFCLVSIFFFKVEGFQLFYIRTRMRLRSVRKKASENDRELRSERSPNLHMCAQTKGEEGRNKQFFYEYCFLVAFLLKIGLKVK